MTASHSLIATLFISSLVSGFVSGCATAPSRDSSHDARNPAFAADPDDSGGPLMTSSVCGTAGTMEEKIQDCGETVVNHKKAEFSLISRTSDGKETWFNRQTQKTTQTGGEAAPE